MNLYKNIVLIWSPDKHTASTHNQSWLQSGLLYRMNDELERKVANLCINSGQHLLSLRNMKRNINGGIMALENEKDAIDRINFLKSHGFEYDEPYINPSSLYKYLGNDFSMCTKFNHYTRFIWTPDQPFDEGDLLRFCEDSLKLSETNFIIRSG